MNSWISELKNHVARQLHDSIEYRHALHSVPELANEEWKTAAIVLDALAPLGVSVTNSGDSTGIIAELDTGRPGPLVVLRADMDALPVDEDSAVAYKSEHQGRAHACGHDGHVAALIGAALVLDAMRDRLCGKVRFLFQPAEENASGARVLIEKGALRDADASPRAIIALHAWPGLPVGTVASKPGTMMASTDAFQLEVIGCGGHSSKPSLALNPLDMMAELIREIPALSGVERIVTVCTAQAGRIYNVIPERGTLSGTCRALTAELRSQTRGDLESLARSLCDQRGYRVNITWQEGCPPLIVDEGLYNLFVQTVQRFDGEIAFHELGHPSMGAEDFAFYLEHGPGLMFRIGVGENAPYLHTPQFNFNDDALESGILMLCAMVLALGEEEAGGSA